MNPAAFSRISVESCLFTGLSRPPFVDGPLSASTHFGHCIVSPTSSDGTSSASFVPVHFSQSFPSVGVCTCSEVDKTPATNLLQSPSLRAAEDAASLYAVYPWKHTGAIRKFIAPPGSAADQLRVPSVFALAPDSGVEQSIVTDTNVRSRTFNGISYIDLRYRAIFRPIAGQTRLSFSLANVLTNQTLDSCTLYGLDGYFDRFLIELRAFFQSINRASTVSLVIRNLGNNVAEFDLSSQRLWYG
jgi:hypothetical protein